MDTKLIKLTRGKFAIVDAEDFEWLNQWKWYAIKCDNKFYAARGIWIRNVPRNKANRRIYMHKQILKIKKGFETDHKDGNSLNNCKSNLRVATRSQNAANRGKQANNKSGFKGVILLKDQKRNKKYLSLIRVNNKNISLGLFYTPEQAAQRYNQAAKEYFGEFANFNQIGGNL